MRVLICGDRYWSSEPIVRSVLSGLMTEALLLKEPLVLVHGDCRGADKTAARIAEELGVQTEAHPADWRRYGAGAGPVRNAEMLASDVKRVIAFHDDLKSSKGTRNMLLQARKARVPFMVYRVRGRDLDSELWLMGEKL